MNLLISVNFSNIFHDPITYLLLGLFFQYQCSSLLTLVFKLVLLLFVHGNF